MVKKIFTYITREIRGLHEAAYILAIFTVTSQVIALVRDKLLAYKFGASETLDIYYAAFRIPDVLFAVIASMVAASILVPFLAEKCSNQNQVDGERGGANNFINSIFTVFIIVFVVVIVVVWLLVPTILAHSMPQFLAGGAAGSELGGRFDELVMITRILLLQPFFFGISNFLSSITQMRERFFLYAISPVLYNLGIVFGILALYPIFGLTGLAIGVVFGALLHGLIHVPAVIRDRLMPRLIALGAVDIASVYRLILTALPRTLTLSAHQISTFFLVALASSMPAGSISIFTFAINLQSVPMALIGASYSSAVFPALARFANARLYRDFIDHATTALRHIIFWSFPITIFAIVLRAQVVRTILGAGKFDWADTRLTAAALAIFIVSAVAQSLILVFVRAYYALGNTRRPLYMNVGSALLIIVLAYIFNFEYSQSEIFRNFIGALLRVDDLNTQVLMLPLAYSIGVLFNALLHWIAFVKDAKVMVNHSLGLSNPVDSVDSVYPGTLGSAKVATIKSAVVTGNTVDAMAGIKSLKRTFFQSLCSSLIGGYVSYAMLQLMADVFDTRTVLGVFSHGFFSGIVGIFVTIIVLYFLASPELAVIWKTLHAKIWSGQIVMPPKDPVDQQ